MTKVTTLLKALEQKPATIAHVGNCFRNLPKANPNDPEFDYRKSYTMENFAQILKLIDPTVSNVDDHYYRLNYNTGTYDCAEIDILKGFGELEFPLDFNYFHATPQKTLSNVIGRVTNFFTHFQNSDIAPKAFTYTLNALSKIDIDASAELRTHADALINIVGTKALQSWSQQPWPVNNSIKLLWGNAVHGLQTDGSYSPVIKWHDVKKILNHVEKEVRNGFTLNPILAKQLFQVYASNYAHKDEFPVNLLKTMRTFTPHFKSTSHGSKYEDRVQLDFKYANGIHTKLKQYGLGKENFDANNPITDFGLETDILFTHKESGVKAAIQVDGNKYHTYRCMDPKNRKADLRTRFRDFCFKQAGYLLLNVNENDNNYVEQVVSFTKNHIQPKIAQKTHFIKNKVVTIAGEDLGQLYDNAFGSGPYAILFSKKNSQRCSEEAQQPTCDHRKLVKP